MSEEGPTVMPVEDGGENLMSEVPLLKKIK
jgi:hypothetical protein